MNARVLRIVFGLAMLAAIGGAGPQPPKKNGDPPAKQGGNPLLEKKAQDLAQQFEQSKRQFLAARDKANEALVGRFDALIKQTKGNRRLPAEVRQAKISTITDERSAFRANGTLPNSDEMLGPLLEHQGAIYKAYGHVAKFYEQLFNMYSVTLKDDGRAQKLAADKGEFDHKARGNTVFTRGNWQGNQRGADNIPFALSVESLEGNSVKGRIVQNRWPGETVFKMEGLLSGNRILLNSTQVVQGRARGLIFTGYVMENRIVGQVVSVATNGRVGQPQTVLLNKR